MLTVGMAPPLQTLGVCKQQWVVHMQRQSWNLSQSPGAAWLRKKGWNLSHVPAAVWSTDLCHQWQFCELSACWTSKWITGAPVTGVSPVIAAAVFVGGHMQRQSWGLDWFHSSHGRYKCTTVVVPMPNFSKSALMNLHWWLCEHSAWRTPRPITCIPMVEVGLRAVSKTMYFVSPHNGWQTPQSAQSALPSGQLLGRNTQWLLSRQKCSSPTYLTLQLRNRYGISCSNNWGADPTPNRAVTTTDKEEAPLNIQCRLCSPQHQSHNLTKQ